VCSVNAFLDVCGRAEHFERDGLLSVEVRLLQVRLPHKRHVLDCGLFRLQIVRSRGRHDAN
jgi:hypothetical protein